MKLQGLPQAFVGFLLRFRAHKEIERITMAAEESRRKIAAQYPVEPVRKIAMGLGGLPCSRERARGDRIRAHSSCRGCRDSSGRPSING